MTLDDFLNNLWQGYTQIAPQALSIRKLLESKEEVWANDHIAFRTYDRAPIALAALEPHLLSFGYERFEPYAFEDKKLRAYGYLHPEEGRPRVFLSELETHKLSDRTNQLIDELVKQVDPEKVKDPSVMFSGPLWDIPEESVYRELLDESEYAGWVAVNGLCANHFTISVNGLKHFDDLDGLMSFLEVLDRGGILRHTDLVFEVTGVIEAEDLGLPSTQFEQLLQDSHVRLGTTSAGEPHLLACLFIR